MDEVTLTEEEFIAIKKQERIDRIIAKWQPAFDAFERDNFPKEKLTERALQKHLGDDSMEKLNIYTTLAEMMNVPAHNEKQPPIEEDVFHMSTGTFTIASPLFRSFEPESNDEPVPEPDFCGYTEVLTANDLMEKSRRAAMNGYPLKAQMFKEQALELIDKTDTILDTVQSDDPGKQCAVFNNEVYEKIEIDDCYILIANENRRFKSNRNLTTGEVHSMVVAQLNVSQEEENDYLVTDDYLKSIVPMHTFKRFFGECKNPNDLNSMETAIALLDSRSAVLPRTLLDVLDIWLALYGDDRSFEDNMERFMTEV